MALRRRNDPARDLPPDQRAARPGRGHGLVTTLRACRKARCGAWCELARPRWAGWDLFRCSPILPTLSGESQTAEKSSIMPRLGVLAPAQVEQPWVDAHSAAGCRSSARLIVIGPGRIGGGCRKLRSPLLEVEWLRAVVGMVPSALCRVPRSPPGKGGVLLHFPILPSLTVKFQVAEIQSVTRISMKLAPAQVALLTLPWFAWRIYRATPAQACEPAGPLRVATRRVSFWSLPRPDLDSSPPST